MKMLNSERTLIGIDVTFKLTFLFQEFSGVLRRVSADQLPALEDRQSGPPSSGGDPAPDPGEGNSGTRTQEKGRIQALGK
jgi:hypothetical protein